MSVLPLFGADEPAQRPAPEPEQEPEAAPPAEPASRAPDAALAALAAAPALAAASQSLYRKYRPRSFDADDLVGQEHIVRTLRNAIRLDRIAHAYLFCGPRGTGKTTTARLIAKAVNCLDPDPDKRPCNQCANCLAINNGTATDIIEIDAASNRGIDDIRDLRERVKYAPTQLKSKFYIVDEAHQITGAAANAFLKTLEEPPPHTRFVLATTDPEELLPTIVSRCQRFDFRRVSAEAMASRLRLVAEQEGIRVDDDAIAEITRHATGSLRDALGLLDQLALHGGDGGSEVGADAVRALLGISRNDRVGALAAALADRDAAAALDTVNTAVESGEDPRQLNRQLVAALRSMMHDRAAGRPTPGDLGPVAERLDVSRIAAILRRLADVDYRIRHASYPQLPLELALVECIAEPSGHAASAPAAARPAAAPRAPEPTPDPGQPTSRLRDRVREAPATAPASMRPAREAAESANAGGEPAQAAPAPEPGPAPAAEEPRMRLLGQQEPPAARSAASLETLVNLWPRIKDDVKAVNRRAEALLAESDPAQIAGNRITIVAAYEFHREKLNSAELRELLQDVISRHLGMRVTVIAALRSDLLPAPASQESAPPTEARGTAAEPAAAVAPSDPDPTDAGDSDRFRIQAAQNIFDADVIDGDAPES